MSKVPTLLRMADNHFVSREEFVHSNFPLKWLLADKACKDTVVGGDANSFALGKPQIIACMEIINPFCMAEM
jgi:hypothetical protein